MIFLCLYGSSLCLLLILKDDALCQLGALQRELEELSGERDSALVRLTHLENTLQEYQEGKILEIFSCRFRKKKTFARKPNDHKAIFLV